MGMRYSLKGGIVANGQTIDPAKPSEDKESEFEQPPYSRGANANQTSARLKWHQGCVRRKMTGQDLKSRENVITTLVNVSKDCEDENPYPKRT